MNLLSGNANGTIFSSWDISNRFVHNPFGSFRPFGLLGFDNGHCFFRQLYILFMVGFKILSLNLGGLDIFYRPSMPRVNVGLVTRAQSGTGPGVYSIVVVQRIFNTAMNSQVSERPKLSLGDLFGRRGPS